MPECNRKPIKIIVELLLLLLMSTVNQRRKKNMRINLARSRTPVNLLTTCKREEPTRATILLTSLL
jgi:hypothetical protein